MKTNELTMELKHIDIAEILANYRKPLFWKKRWCVFKTQDFYCVWKLSKINIDNNVIESTVALNYTGKKYKSFYHQFISYCRDIPIDNPEYNQNIFNRNLLSCVINTISYLEREIASRTYEYNAADELEDAEEIKLRNIAEEFLDEHNVKNEEIREAYIDHYLDKATRHHYKQEVLNRSERRYFPTARLMASSWFDNKETFDSESSILKETKNIKKKIIYEIWKSRKQLDGEDFVENAKELLEEI